MGQQFVLCGWRLRRRHCISATGVEGINRCTGVVSGHLIDTVNKGKRKRTQQRKRAQQRKKVQRQTIPDLVDEIVWEILVRLPVESLVQFKSVSKAWHTIISDPLFVHAHLQCSKQKQHQNPSSFLITPQILLRSGPDAAAMVLSTNIRLYHWRLQEDLRSTATLLHETRFPGGESRAVSRMAHCDGLVLLPTESETFVFNPATRDAMALPESQRNMFLHHECLPTGLGLDASTAKYKVARCFYRSRYNDPVAMGMEVFAIGEDESWRETHEDPPYPMLDSQTGTYCQGCLFFFINKEKSQRQAPQGLLRFNLQDETFGVTPLLPNLFPRVADKDVLVTELDGELSATFFCKVLQRVLIFTTMDVLDPEWRCRYILDLPKQCVPMASLGTGRILLRGGKYLFRYCLEVDDPEEDGIFDMDELRFLGPNQDKMGHEWASMYRLDLISYTESLIPITPKASLQAI